MEHDEGQILPNPIHAGPGDQRGLLPHDSFAVVQFVWVTDGDDKVAENADHMNCQDGDEDSQQEWADPSRGLARQARSRCAMRCVVHAYRLGRARISICLPIGLNGEASHHLIRNGLTGRRPLTESGMNRGSTRKTS